MISGGETTDASLAQLGLVFFLRQNRRLVFCPLHSAIVPYSSSAPILGALVFEVFLT
jgi:hypothetical protein